MSVGVFFDLDGTVVKGVAGLRFSRFLFRRKLLLLKLGGFVPMLKAVYNIFNNDVSDVIRHFDELWASSMKGVRREVIAAQAKIYAPLELDKVYKKVLDRINYHKKEGHVLFLLSASPDELVKELGKLLGFDFCIGTRLSVKKGVYTGVVRHPYLSGNERLDLMKRLARKYKVDLSKSYAYGNSLNDADILESVGNPVVVYPDKSLAKLAEKEEWKKL